MVLRVFGALFAQGKASQLASMDDWPLAWHGLSLKIRSICFGCRRMVRMICSRMSCSCEDCSPISIVLQYSKQHASSQLIRLSQNLIFLSINLTFPKSPKPQSSCQKTKVCRLCGPCRCPEAWGQWLRAAPSLRAQGPQVPAFHTTLLESKTLGKARLARFGTKIVGFLGSWPAARRRSCGFIQFLFLLTFFLKIMFMFIWVGQGGVVKLHILQPLPVTAAFKTWLHVKTSVTAHLT